MMQDHNPQRSELGSIPANSKLDECMCQVQPISYKRYITHMISTEHRNRGSTMIESRLDELTGGAEADFLLAGYSEGKR